ncbi:hypothetical protein EEB14_52270, partial [Rhodococcus sp. WS4]
MPVGGDQPRRREPGAEELDQLLGVGGFRIEQLDQRTTLSGLDRFDAAEDLHRGPGGNHSGAEEVAGPQLPAGGPLGDLQAVAGADVAQGQSLART